jgi:hypothetical protein
MNGTRRRVVVMMNGRMRLGVTKERPAKTNGMRMKVLVVTKEMPAAKSLYMSVIFVHV